MKIKVVNFKGVIKWLVTTRVIYADPLYYKELLKKIKDKKI